MLRMNAAALMAPRSRKPKPLAPAKPLAGQPSTKPSDRPMAQQKLAIKKQMGLAPLPSVPQIPKLVAKPVSSAKTTSRARRPKTGTK